LLRVPARFLELHSSGSSEESIDAHAIQFYYTLFLAKQAAMTVQVLANADAVTLIAV
jgi:histidine phosphotransferase ChpT